MMIRSISAAIFALALSGAAAAACTDEASAQAYLDSFATDMTAAAEAGKIDESGLRDIQSTMTKLMDDLSADNFAAFCKGLDELRADYAF